MATIVCHVSSNRNFVLVGSGFGATRSESPSLFLGSLAPEISKQEYALVCVADEAGAMHWAPTDQFRVISVDGHSPSQLLSNDGYR